MTGEKQGRLYQKVKDEVEYHKKEGIKNSLNFSQAPLEVQEPENPQIAALIDSPLADVNKHLAEGYMVMPDKIYSKNAILVK